MRASVLPCRTVCLPLSTATGWTALIACFSGDLGKGFMRTRSGGWAEDTCMAEHWVETTSGMLGGVKPRPAATVPDLRSSSSKFRNAFTLSETETSFSTWDATPEDGPKWPLN